MVSVGSVGELIAINLASVPQSSSRARRSCIGEPSPDRTRRGNRATSSATATCTVRAASCDALPAEANPSHPRPVVRRSFQLALAPGPLRAEGKCAARSGAASSTPSRRRAMSRMLVWKPAWPRRLRGRTECAAKHGWPASAHSADAAAPPSPRWTRPPGSGSARPRQRRSRAELGRGSHNVPLSEPGASPDLANDLCRVHRFNEAGPEQGRRSVRATASVPMKPGVLRGADREREDAGGVRAGRGAVSGVVRGARPRPRRRVAASRRGLHPDAPGVGPDRQAAPGRPVSRHPC